MTTESARWCTSSYSGNGGQCVAVATNLAATHGMVPIRDSKAPDGPVLSIASHGFAVFVEAVKSGSLNRP